MSSSTSTSPFSNPVVLGITRGLIGFPFEHPLELMKMSAQANPTISSKEVFQRIYRKNGFKGFSNTILLNFPRRVMRESLRWPVVNYTHLFFTRTFPTIFTHDNVSTKIMTGASVALFDSCVLLPLEQLMAYRVKEGLRYRTFYQKRFKQDGILSLYRGFNANLIRQGVVWMTFMGLNHEIKKKFDKLDTNNVHPILRQSFTSVTIASTVIAIGLPLDFTKVQIQMNPELQKISISETFRILKNRYRFRGFYAGLIPIFVHSVFQATVKGIVADKIFQSQK